MLPAYLPNPVAALLGGGLPIDLGRSAKDGRRVLGDGKTYRGLIPGVIAGIAVGLLEIWLADTYGWSMLPGLTLTSVVLLSVGALLGDISKSFFKRRLGKERGDRWPIADQYDLVAGAFLLLLILDPKWLFANMTLPVFLVILVITPILHRVVNVLGFAIGVKEVPW